ncbi:MAG: glycine zipper domain-containing protein [Fimbriiglobus sp.]|nr:glycine zipper domain-containing protein [Fimbriiglobus sp.]
MKRKWMTRAAVLAVGAAGLLGTGCETMNNQERGTLGGAGVGSVAGALIGGATGNPKTGAVVGGLAGGLAGNLIGRDADRKEERADAVRQATAEQSYRDHQPARIAEIVQLTQQGQDENVILNHIKANRMTFSLSVDDLNTLKTNNVSSKVITAMQNSGAGPTVIARPSRPVVVREEVIVERPVYIAPPPPPPIFYGPPTGVVMIGGRIR